MATCGPDIHETASKLVKDHGKDAEIVARQWARCASRAGEQERMCAWVQILNLVKKLCSCNDLTMKLERDSWVMKQAVAKPARARRSLPRRPRIGEQPLVLPIAE